MTFNIERRRLEDICDEVLPTYATLKRSRALLRVRQAKIDGSGEVPALEIDFIIDVELKAERVLHGEFLAIWEALKADPDDHAKLPLRMKQALGATFEEHNLGADGHYNKVYFRVKRNSDRRRFNSEEENAGSSSNRIDTDYLDGDTFGVIGDFPDSIESPGYLAD